MTGSRYHDAYLRLVNIESISTYLLFVYIIRLEADYTDVSISYLHIFTKENIQTFSWT